MQVKSIAECSKGSILQYFWPSDLCFVYFWVAVLHRFDCIEIFILSELTYPFDTVNLTNSEDPDEMQQNAAFHQDLHYLLR